MPLAEDARLPARPIRFAAKHTFTLYLSHSVVICGWPALATFRRADPSVMLELALAIVLVTAALQPLTEALRRVLRR
jgi:peptidoglycan/LPS O-acetylase OafA/YrhL